MRPQAAPARKRRGEVLAGVGDIGDSDCAGKWGWMLLGILIPAGRDALGRR